MVNTIESATRLDRRGEETAFFFRNGAHRLFGVLHAPKEASNGNGAVFCHPFGEEKLWAQRVFVHFARDLAARGWTVLRFDYFGNGDSDGEFAESSVETALSDIHCAIRTLRSETSVREISVLGLRLGATLAAVAVEREPAITRLMLWEPIVDGASYMQEMLRAHLMTQTAVYREIRHDRQALVEIMKQGRTVNVDGYELSYSMFRQASDLKLSVTKKRFNGRCLIVQIGNAGQKPSEGLKELQAGYPSADLRQAAEEPFWKEIKRFYRKADHLFQTTLDWLQ